MGDFSGDYSGDFGGAPGGGGGIQFGLKLRGLPWSATQQDIVEFLEDRCAAENVTICMGRDGRPSGEALVGFSQESDWTFCQLKHKQNMGKRYVEVYDCPVEQLQNASYDQGGQNFGDGGGGHVIKMRGMPFSATEQDIIDFLEGCAISPGGIVICLGHSGQPNGEALVQFEDKLSVDTGLLKHKQNMGQRYVEIFKASVAEFRRAQGGGGDRMGGGPMRHGRMGGGDRRSAPYGGGGRGRGRDGYGDEAGLDDNGQYKHIVHVRGLPYRATEREITNFFRPLETIACRMLFGNDGRPSGEADVAFLCHQDARDAMAKNKQNVGSRYVELFLRSKEEHGGWGGGGGHQQDDYAWGGAVNQPRGGRGGYGGGRGGGYGGGGRRGGGRDW